MVAAIAPGGRGIRPDDGGGERQEARSIEVKILPKKLSFQSSLLCNKFMFDFRLLWHCKVASLKRNNFLITSILVETAH